MLHVVGDRYHLSLWTWMAATSQRRLEMHYLEWPSPSWWAFDADHRWSFPVIGSCQVLFPVLHSSPVPFSSTAVNPRFNQPSPVMFWLIGSPDAKRTINNKYTPSCPRNDIASYDWSCTCQIVATSTAATAQQKHPKISLSLYPSPSPRFSIQTYLKPVLSRNSVPP